MIELTEHMFGRLEGSYELLRAVDVLPDPPFTADGDYVEVGSRVRLVFEDGSRFPAVIRNTDVSGDGKTTVITFLPSG